MSVQCGFASLRVRTRADARRRVVEAPGAARPTARGGRGAVREQGPRGVGVGRPWANRLRGQCLGLLPRS